MPEVLKPGRNCWRVETAARAAVLVDAEEYFAWLADAMEAAERCIFLVGWDVHSRMRLRRDGGSEETLRELLDRLSSRRRALKIRILSWDFALVYALERELLPKARFDFATHRGVSFALDGDHPRGGSKHQKIAVVDDAIAFVGGIDLTVGRWDTPAHRGDDSRRRDPGFGRHAPFHDVQMAVDGAAAAALGELARERLRRVTGERFEPPHPGGADPWPRRRAPTMRDVRVGIARTDPEWRDQPGVHEVWQLYDDALRSGRDFIYLEHQFLTSHRVGATLEELLLREEGAEVVIVGPFERSDWIEEETLGALRRRMIARLRRADLHGRLRLFYPRLVSPSAKLNVHSKVLVVDGAFLRIGSANLTNRSMGLDSECDLAVEAEGRGDLEDAIMGTLARLLGEHLGCTPDAVRESIEAHGSLIRGIESLRGGPRTLETLPAEELASVEQIITAEEIVDPEEPIDPAAFVGRLFPPTLEDHDRRERRHAWTALGLGALALASLAAAWRFTPLSSRVSVEALAALVEPLHESAWGAAAAVAAFVVAGTLMVPVTALIVATVLVFGGAVGFFSALAGSFITAALGYAIGGRLWHGALNRLMGKRASKVARQLARRGLLTVVILRVVPVAPFTVVNLMAGASHIRWRDYALGTVLGMTPGVLGLALIADELLEVVRDPSPAQVALAVGLVLAVAGVLGTFRRWLLRRDERRDAI